MKKNSALRLKYQQSSQKAILRKIPADFIGIAREYGSAKKQRMNCQKNFDTKLNELNSIEKISYNLNKKLSKKKKQLEFVQSVHNRYVSQSLHKQKLKQLKQIELTQLRNRTLEQRYDSEARLAESKQTLLRNRRSFCELTKKELRNYKSNRLLEESRLFEKNQSRVKQIENEKIKIRQQCYKFYQNKNRKSMQSYKQRIFKQKAKEQQMYKEMKNLEKKLLLLKEDRQRKQKIIDELNSSINSIRLSKQSMRQSRPLSGCSMTPLQIISGTSTSENPEKLKFKFLTKKQIQE